MSLEITSGIRSNRVFKLAIAALFIAGSLRAVAAAGGCGHFAELDPGQGKGYLQGQTTHHGHGHVRADDDYGRPARGKLQSDGTFVLTTDKEGDGVVAGHHQVYITNINPKSKARVAQEVHGLQRRSKLNADVSPERTEFTFELD